MPFIGNQPALSYTSFAKQDFTTSATTSYTLDNPVTNENEIALFINFVRQEPTTAYTASGTSLTLTSATSASDDMYCVFLGKAVQTVNPPNGSVGTSQLESSLDLSSKTITLASNMKATPAFRVYLNSNTAQTQNTDTKIPYNTEDFDTDNAYDNSSNYRFTPQTSGKYFIQVQVGFDGADANGRVVVYVFKNGSSHSFSSFGMASTADYGGVCQHSDIVTLNGSTDYVEGFVNYTGTDNMRGQTQKTFMLGYRIIGA